MKAKGTTVASYLVRRLQQLGVEDAFGVPGDYVLDFLDVVIEEGIHWRGTCNELNAAYAADGYARLKGMGLVVVTYGVGTLSAINGVAGAYAERVPLVVVSGSAHSVHQKNENSCIHHLSGRHESQLAAFREFTVAQVAISDSLQAPKQLDDALKTAMEHRRPVYIEIPLDLVYSPCADMEGPLNLKGNRETDKESLNNALEASLELFKAAERPIILAGVEVHRLNLQETFRALVEKTGCPFATYQEAKSLIEEQHPQFIGNYFGACSRPETQNFIESSDCVLRLGIVDNDVSTGIYTANLPEETLITASAGQVKVQSKCYEKIALSDFIPPLLTRLDCKACDEATCATIRGDFAPRALKAQRALEVDYVYRRFNAFLKPNYVLIADAGDALFGSADMQCYQNGFISQSHYLSIGYALPATFGISLAAPNKRAVLMIGDGSFQMTAQELSSIIRSDKPTVVFIFNNDGYVIERLIHDGPYNDIQPWHYHAIYGVFGGKAENGMKVATEGELEKALEDIENRQEESFLVNLILPSDKACDALIRLGKAIRDKQQQ